MNTTSITLDFDQLDPIFSRVLLSQIIDKHINLLKLQSLADWEKNHTTSLQSQEEKIEQLLKAKEEVNSFIQNNCLDSSKLDIVFQVSLVKQVDLIAN